jgi:hypothetical protein
MKTYVKLEGKDVKKGIKALEKLAVDIPEVCITNTFIQSNPDLFNTQTGILNYFPSGVGMEKRCMTIISADKDTKGYDFVFDWFDEPTGEQIQQLKIKIQDALEPLGLKFRAESKAD